MPRYPVDRNGVATDPARRAGAAYRRRAGRRRQRRAAIVNPGGRIGPYRVERLLGFGSFATVWLGHDPALDSRVAIKVLAENWCHDLRVRERFLEEGRLLRRLEHERLVRVYAVGELDDGQPYLVMAWAEGGSLRDRLGAGPLPVGPALRVLREIAAGVGVLHANGIVHRDLTPGNVLFGTRPESLADGLAESVLIADLGLAKALAVASGLTARAGTPGYMAPEQDSPSALVDARADVFGLGRLGTTLLGVGPVDPADDFPADRPPETAGSRSSGPTLRAGVPPGVAAVLRTATARRPADRYPDASAFGAALDRATRAGPTGGRFRVRRRALLAAALLTVLVTLSATALAVLLRDGDESTGTDSTGRITVALPPGWRVGGAGWLGQRGPDGTREPAMVVSPDPDRWHDEPTVPGAFVGFSRDLGTRHTPAGYVSDQHPHAECVASPVRTVRLGAVDWFVAGFTACRTGKPVLVEAAGPGPDGAGLVYVQLAPPAESTPDFVDTLLAGVRVRP